RRAYRERGHRRRPLPVLMSAAPLTSRFQKLLPPRPRMDLHSAPAEASTLMERILYEVKRVVVGQDHFLERVMVAVLAQGHLLVEGVPGLAKTLTVKTLAQALRGSFKRI